MIVSGFKAAVRMLLFVVGRKVVFLCSELELSS